MEVIRELWRDLVGIIFPGGLLIIFLVWLVFGLAIVIYPADLFSKLTIGNGSIEIFVLLIFSYTAGQFLRLKQLNDLDKDCTNAYRKKEKPEISKDAFDDSIANLKKTEQSYYAGELNYDELKKEFKQHIKKFGFWEEFPYSYHLKGRDLLQQSKEYNEFFEQYDKEGILKRKRFFNYCKIVIYEHSAPLKEEVIRQENLVRLFAGIYYVVKFGIWVSIVLGILHLFMFASFYLFPFTFLAYENIEFFLGIVGISVFTIFVLRYLRIEILSRLRYMRMKELNLVFDSFYILSKRVDLEIQ